jgi:hypothetical protein
VSFDTQIERERRKKKKLRKSRGFKEVELYAKQEKRIIKPQYFFWFCFSHITRGFLFQPTRETRMPPVPFEVVG